MNDLKEIFPQGVTMTAAKAWEIMGKPEGKAAVMAIVKTQPPPRLPQGQSHNPPGRRSAHLAMIAMAATAAGAQGFRTDKAGIRKVASDFAALVDELARLCKIGIR